MDETLLNAVVIGACALVWLAALVAGIWRVRHGRDRRGLILAVLALTALGVAVVMVTGTDLGKHLSTAPRDRVTGPSAVLVASWQGRGELHYRLGPRQLASRGEQGRYTVQSGSLRLSSFTAYAGQGPTAWEADTRLYEVPPLTLAPGQEQALQVGPPYLARVEADPQFRRVALKVTDVGGRSTSLSDARRTSPPALEIADARGRVVWQGKFAYG